eukprot:m.80964 g.80964  ORF g.80964 m.80964 type:complete len:659 (+) comp8638_c3_seq1:59-2035(+)
MGTSAVVFGLFVCAFVISANSVATASTNVKSSALEAIFGFCGTSCPSLNATHLNKDDLVFIIESMNGTITRMYEGSACFDADSLLNGKETLDTTDLEAVAVQFLLAGAGPSSNCTQPSSHTAFVSLFSETADSIRAGAFGAYHRLNLEPLKHLEHVVSTDMDHAALFECTPVEELIMNTSSLATLDEQVTAISLAVIAMHLNGECLLPVGGNTTIFVTSLFNEYAHNGMLDEDGFVLLYEALGLDSGIATESSGHTHRRRSLEPTVCFHPPELAAEFGYNLPLTKTEFEHVCVGLVYMLESGDCAEGATVAGSTTLAERWGYSFLSAALSSIVSFSGAVVLLCSLSKKGQTDVELADEFHEKVHYLNNNVLIVMMSLSIGTLLADAMLHLIPHAIGVESMGGSGDPYGYLWKMCMVLVGFYFFFMIEVIIAKLTGGETHEHHHGRHHNNAPHHDTEMCDLEMEEMAHVISLHEETKAELVAEQKLHSEKHHKHDGEPAHHIAKSAAALVLLGDGVHNFVDGLAIAASFSASNLIGFSTTLAIICHEVPHEIGDFVILLDSGMKARRALFYNFISSLTCFAGVVVGLLITQSIESEAWILPVGAGLFIYIAVSDITPHVLQHIVSAKSFFKALFYSNLGMFAGVASLLLLARYEEDIHL